MFDSPPPPSSPADRASLAVARVCCIHCINRIGMGPKGRRADLPGKRRGVKGEGEAEATLTILLRIRAERVSFGTWKFDVFSMWKGKFREYVDIC